MKKTIEVLEGAKSTIRIAKFALCVLVTLAVGSTAAFGAQCKTLVNSSNQPISVTLLVRGGVSPAAQAGIVFADLAAGASNCVAYGSPTNIYLNGVTITSGDSGNVYTQQATVTKRASTLDNTLNTNSFIVFTFSNSVFTITGHN
jgi:hypothetical protein